MQSQITNDISTLIVQLQRGGVFYYLTIPVTPQCRRRLSHA